MARIKWVDRTFDFNFPAELYPELIERFRGTPARIEDRIKGLSYAVVTRQDGGSWSIQENIGHLLDLEELFAWRLDDFDSELQALSAADMTNRKTHQASHNKQPLENILRDFRKARAANVHRLEACDSSYFSRTAIHPRLNKSMRVTDMIYFQAEHDDFHLARISELIRQFEAKV